jgi:preprotein translocase subunit SecG
MVTFLTGLHLIVCIFLIIVVLLQAGKGGGMGIAFGGGGGSQTVFGSSGAGNFLTRLTSATAFIFLITSLGLAHYSSQQDSSRLQRLAERKAVEKKVEDDRAAKLKSELDKAREAAKKTTPEGDLKAPPADTSEAPAGALPMGKPGDLKLTAPKVGSDAKAPAVKAKPAAAPAGTKAAAGTTSDGETPKPVKKKRRAAPADGDTSAPSVPPPPPEAPAAPAP